MAWMKQTARKQEPQPGTSRGGYQLATQRSPHFLDSDAEIDAAAQLFGVNTSSSSNLSLKLMDIRH